MSVIVIVIVVVIVVTVTVTVTVVGGGGDGGCRRGLAELRGAHAVAELAGPADPALVGGAAAGRGGPHPAGREGVVTLLPQLPRQLLPE